MQRERMSGTASHSNTIAAMTSIDGTAVAVIYVECCWVSTSVVVGLQLLYSQSNALGTLLGHTMAKFDYQHPTQCTFVLTII